MNEKAPKKTRTNRDATKKANGTAKREPDSKHRYTCRNTTMQHIS